MVLFIEIRYQYFVFTALEQQEHNYVLETYVKIPDQWIG